MQLYVCSVVVREDKKLLTVLFPDGRDGRAFTLKVIYLGLYHICIEYFVLYYFLLIKSFCSCASYKKG